MENFGYHISIFIITFIIFYLVFILKGKNTEKLRKKLLPKSVNDMRMMGHNQELVRRIEILEDEYSKLIKKLDHLIYRLEGD